MLAHHRRNLRPGGVFVAVDYDMSGVRARPEVELFTRVGSWLEAGFRHAQADPSVGMLFPVLFRDAGFADVGTLGLQLYWPPDNSEAAGYVVGVVRALHDAILASGVVTADELDLDTLEQRLGEQIRAAGACGRCDDRRWLGPASLSPPFTVGDQPQSTMAWFGCRLGPPDEMGAVIADPRAPFPRVISPTRLIARSSVVAAGTKAGSFD